MMKSPILLLIACMSLSVLNAQNELDALRHSQSSLPAGTARSMGMGGAFSAVGADLSSAATNPAGLGLFRQSVFSFTPVFRTTQTSSQYLDTTGSGETSYLRVPSIGVSFYNRTYSGYGAEDSDTEPTGVLSYSVAFGINQLENYTRETKIEDAFNPYSSIGQYFADRSQGLSPTNLGVVDQLAFQLLIIDTVALSDGRTYFPAASEGQVAQTVQRQETGRRNEWYFGFGANYSDKVYFGASLGLQTLRYEQDFTFNEQDINNLYEFYYPYDDNVFPLQIPTNEIRFLDNFTTRGTGFNGKAGVILRPVDALRISVSGQTPTFLTLTDQFTTTLVHSLTLSPTGGPEEYTAETDPASFEYSLMTPWKAGAGLMYQIGKFALISAEADYTDYRSARLRSIERSISSPGYYAFRDENARIQEYYKGTFNYRIGAEARVDIFRLRAGAALYGSPLTQATSEYTDFNNLQNLLTINASRKFLTLGAGIRQPSVHVDVAYIYQFQQDKFSPYTVQAPDSFQPVIINKVQAHTVAATVGFNF